MKTTNPKQADTVISETTKAYLAGLLDGEGCIFIGKHIGKQRGNGLRRRTYYRLSVIFCMKNKAPLEYVRRYYGGTIGPKVHGGQNKHRDRRYHRLTLGGDTALKFLKDVRPYIVLKKQSIKWAIEFQEHVNNNFRHKGERDCSFETVLAERKWFYHMYRAAAETERESGLEDRSPMRQSTLTG